jgi:hypothetical protein
MKQLQLIGQWVLGCYNSDLQSLLKGFVDGGYFELTFDDGSKAISAQPEILPRLGDGTKLVMSVVTFLKAPRQLKSVPCPSCSSSIPITVSTESGTQERVFWCVNLNTSIFSFSRPTTFSLQSAL